MKTRFIPALITLIAAACVSVINILNKTELVTGLKTLLYVIVIFYILGLIVKMVINKTVIEDIPKEEELQDVDGEEQATEDSDTNDKIDELSNKSL